MNSKIIRTEIVSMVDYISSQTKSRLYEFMNKKNKLSAHEKQELLEMMESEIKRSFVETYGDVERRLNELK